MLLFAAGLFFRGALKAGGLDPGFVAAGDLVTEMDFSLVKREPAVAKRLLFNVVEQAKKLLAGPPEIATVNRSLPIALRQSGSDSKQLR